MADYYADSDVAGPGAGTFADPWDDIASNINSLSAGDTLYLRGDSESYRLYVEPEILINVNGSSGSPITIRPYQDERAEIRKSTYGEIFDVNGDWIVIDGVASDRSQLYINKNDSAGYAMRIDGDNVTFQNFEVANILGAGSDSLLYLSSTSTSATMDNLLIHDAFESNSSDSAGIGIEGASQFTIKNCTIYDCAGDCIIIGDQAETGYGWTIQDNVLYTTRGEGSENGIDAKWNTSDGRATISGNTVHGFYVCTGTAGGSGDGDGEAICIHNSCDYVDCYDNIIYDCSSGIVVEDNVTSIVVRNNLIYDLHTLVEDTNAGAYGIAAFHIYGSDIDVINNTVHNSPVNSFIFWGSSSGVEIRNNILNDCHNIYNEGATGITWSNNCWYNCNETVSGSGDVTDDPLFSDEGADDYTLASNSPCIDAGTDVGLDYNGSAPDIGYWESDYVGVSVTAAGYAVLKETASATAGMFSWLQEIPSGGVVVINGSNVVINGAYVRIA